MRRLLSILIMFAALVASAIAQDDVPPVLANDDSLPVPGSVYLDPSNQQIFYSGAGGSFTIGEISLGLTGPRFAPGDSPGIAIDHDLAGTADLTLQGGGIKTRYPGIPIQATIEYVYTGEVAGEKHYNTEMLSLSLSGGGLPAGVAIRESPTLHSVGYSYAKRSAIMANQRS